MGVVGGEGWGWEGLVGWFCGLIAEFIYSVLETFIREIYTR